MGNQERIGTTMRIDFKKVLDADQYEAATTKDGTVLILAGAGSGKTRTLTHRVAWLIDQGASPSEILLLTFTNKAANEMRDRAVSLLDDRCKEITACTYHSFCTRMLRRYGTAIGIPHDFGILSSPDVESTLSVIRAQNKQTYKLRGFPHNGIVSSMISVSVNTGQDLGDVIGTWQRGKYEKYSEEIRSLATSYVSYKREHDLLDYDDLLVMFIRLLETNEPIRRKISDTFRYIMVDEYQDTNRLQERILFDLRRDSDNLVVVGDDYQSIYAFRGADINNIIEFPQRVRRCDKVVHVMNNYRSSREICDFANAVMRNHARFGFPKQMKATRWADMQPTLVRPYDESEEAEWVYRRIRELHDSEGVPYKDMAVLARTGRDTFLLENLLNADGMAYEKYGGLKFLEYRCVLDVIAFMRVLVSPLSELPWFRILPLYPGIGERYAYLITQGISGAEGATDPLGFLLDRQWSRKRFHPSLEELHEELLRLSEMEFDALPSEIVSYYMTVRKNAIEMASYDDEANRTKDLEKLEEDKLALDALVNMTGNYKSVNEFLDAIILDSLPKTPAQANAIGGGGGTDDMLVLSTIHSIKGLEFSVVFVLDCVRGKFPRQSQGDSEDEDMEDLRCFYVAITRAKDQLYVMAPKVVRTYGGTPERTGVTPFLDGVDDDLYEVIDPARDGDAPVDDSPWDDWDGFGIPF